MGPGGRVGEEEGRGWVGGEEGGPVGKGKGGREGKGAWVEDGEEGGSGESESIERNGEMWRVVRAGKGEWWFPGFVGEWSVYFFCVGRGWKGVLGFWGFAKKKNK